MPSAEHLQPLLTRRASPRLASLSSFVSLVHKCLSPALRTAWGNWSESLDIHPSLSDRCLPISLTLLGSYCELPGCSNVPLRTAPGATGSAWLPYRLLADTAADWSCTPSPPRHVTAVGLCVIRGEKCEEACNSSYNDDDSGSIPNTSAGS